MLDWQSPPEEEKKNSEGFSHKRVRSNSKYQQATQQPARQQVQFDSQQPQQPTIKFSASSQVDF